MRPGVDAPTQGGCSGLGLGPRLRALVIGLMCTMGWPLVGCESRQQAAEVERTQLQTTPTALAAASTVPNTRRAATGEASNTQRAAEPRGDVQPASVRTPADGNPPPQPSVGGASEAQEAQLGEGAPAIAQLADAGVQILSKEVKVVFKTVPPVWASVRMGSKKLGTIKGRDPLVLMRPRDSGPLDVVIRAQGYLPVHTRAYTFDDSEVDVKMTKVEDKHTLYGFKEPLPPVDAGVPTL